MQVFRVGVGFVCLLIECLRLRCSHILPSDRFSATTFAWVAGLRGAMPLAAVENLSDDDMSCPQKTDAVSKQPTASNAQTSGTKLKTKGVSKTDLKKTPPASKAGKKTPAVCKKPATGQASFKRPAAAVTRPVAWCSCLWVHSCCTDCHFVLPNCLVDSCSHASKADGNSAKPKAYKYLYHKQQMYGIKLNMRNPDSLEPSACVTAYVAFYIERSCR